MAFIKSLYKRLFTPASASERELPVDHFEQLDFLRRHHDWIHVTVLKNSTSHASTGATDNRYQSLIIEIDPDNKELVIDELYPTDNLQNLQAGDTLEVSSHSKQINLRFFTRLLAKETRDGNHVLRLEMPEEIGRNQSRGAYRVYVENEVGLEIDINLNEEPIPAVEIINLSTDGIKLSFPRDMNKVLGTQRIFHNCLIYLPDGTAIDCDIHLKNLYSIRSPHSHSLGGGKLIINDPQFRVKLQQFLASVQRRQRRQENRS